MERMVASEVVVWKTDVVNSLSRTSGWRYRTGSVAKEEKSEISGRRAGTRVGGEG